MRRQPPPLRFLAAVAALWVCARAALLAPDWWVERSAAAPAPASGTQRASADSASPAPHGTLQVQRRSLDRTSAQSTPVPGSPTRPRPAPPPLAFAHRELALPWDEIRPVATPPASPLPWPHADLPAGRAAEGRFSGSAWLLLRDDRQAGLAPGGTLGGSQTGLRMLYRLNGDAARPLALSARLTTQTRNRRSAEAALGLDWRPRAALPLHILAERRQKLGRSGRSAFALAIHGGVSERALPAGFRLDAYGQAGIVGTRSRDKFADGSARITLPVGRASLGAGIWGGAQPGAARLDAGPHASLRLNLAGQSFRLAAEWRLRVAGDARPGSGPVLTLGSDF